MKKVFQRIFEQISNSKHPKIDNSHIPDFSQMHRDLIQIKAVFDKAVDLLAELRDLQNDAPLEKYREEWEKTMDEIWRFYDRNNLH